MYIYNTDVAANYFNQNKCLLKSVKLIMIITNSQKTIVLALQIQLSQLFTESILRLFENFYTYVATNK